MENPATEVSESKDTEFASLSGCASASVSLGGISISAMPR